MAAGSDHVSLALSQPTLLLLDGLASAYSVSVAMRCEDKTGTLCADGRRVRSDSWPCTYLRHHLPFGDMGRLSYHSPDCHSQFTRVRRPTGAYMASRPHSRYTDPAGCRLCRLA